MSDLIWGGVDVAMKVPPHQYDATVSFYRDVVKLREIEGNDTSFELGPIRLWIDKVPAMSQAELWLEFLTPDFDRAAEHLEKADVPRCDLIEPLPPGLRGGWILNPAGIVHLVREMGRD
ncbi:hypothetical protein HJB56_30320 [Rhizobium lentis]|uniref:hypothetical protein n=1 Tax=Rhizobium lentis TaxID=1138194 RepID=UPI001C83853F|nr:hypothetical protein [Rhizobium lentis]MBX4959504.1 hypothetical protein [Rhizobium lentis]MBX4977461.1 hypothetical protein [Rhizobium lentis]MBX4989324.1 hypothetical protein [Rhizobium lentis]MBX5002088.1 hypothetical protein [Rhizobium lentis]MBX5007882.1 hypothetical protein [Rhizobium lentis]